MTNRVSHIWRKVLRLWGMVLLLAAGVWLVKIIQENAMKERIDAMPMKTVCVGRFLLDVPLNATISFRGTYVSPWKISTNYEQSDDRFASELLEKIEKVREQRNEKGGESLEVVTDIGGANMTGKVMLFNREWYYSMDFGKRVDRSSATILGRARIDGVSFELESESLGIEKIPEVVQLIQLLKPFKESEIPTDPGFCFERILIGDTNTDIRNESTVMFVGLEGHPDLSIALHTLAGIRPQPTLLQRHADSGMAEEYPWAFHKFRLGSRTVNGIPGEELMYRVRERSGVTGHDFQWEAPSKPESILRPHLSLEMSTGHGRPGEPVQSSLSDAEAIALWDKMLSSLRLRPTQPRPAPTPAPQQPVDRVKAGEPCPITGLWKCDDGEGVTTVRGGAQQYFRQGVNMPQADLLAPRSLLQKLKGNRPTFQLSAATTWFLVKADGPMSSAPAVPRVEQPASEPPKNAS